MLESLQDNELSEGERCRAPAHVAAETRGCLRVSGQRLTVKGLRLIGRLAQEISQFYVRFTNWRPRLWRMQTRTDGSLHIAARECQVETLTLLRSCGSHTSCWRPD